MRTRTRIPTLALTAAVGAWLGHFFEYVAASGWHAGINEMATSVHLYFLPAGAALATAVLCMGGAAARTWASLGRRLGAARVGLFKSAGVAWRRDGSAPSRPDGNTAVSRSVTAEWAILTLLQVAIWTVQENIETVAAGHRAPLLGVVTGAHLLAPVVQAEVALILAVLTVLWRRQLGRLASQVSRLETLAARRWGRVPVPSPPRAVVYASTPHELWGRQLWQRPPPSSLAAA